MSYNKQYNTRNSGRYNTPGQFIPASEVAHMPTRLNAAGAGRSAVAPRRVPPPLHQQSQRLTQSPMFMNPPPPAPSQNKPFIQNQNQNLQTIQTTDLDMNTEPLKTEKMDTSTTVVGEDGVQRPHWMKSKLAGVKKVSNRERRRRQNENLRKLITPKNALMVLNEMMPNEQLANQFKVEQASHFNTSYYCGKSANSQHSFCADLTLDGNTYKGYGENKLLARNAAAEQAIRDLIIKKMTKVFNSDSVSQTEDSNSAAGNGASEEEALPMIQLASFALHKLFAEWEYEGHKVPQLKPNPNSTSESQQPSESGAPSPKPKPTKKPKELPANAASMHPCMLLTYMRPQLEYRELAVTGDRPQNMIFTLGVDVDGATYIGKAANKKEARRAAARAACTALFSVQFEDVGAAQ